MDSFGFENSNLINLQLAQLKNQCEQSCKRLNIQTSFQKPVHLWLDQNIRGCFKPGIRSCGFNYAKSYKMQWTLLLKHGDIRFIVLYDSLVFKAIETYFDIAELDEETIIGSFVEAEAFENILFNAVIDR